MAEDEEQKKPGTRLVLIMVATLACMILIISYVTANSLGERSERLIQGGYMELNAIVESYSEQVSNIVLGSTERPEALVDMVRAYFVAPPEQSDERYLFGWMKVHDIAMSDFRHEKIHQLITEGRDIFQERYIDLQQLKHSYKESIDSFYTGFWLTRHGYPRIIMQGTLEEQPLD